MNDEQKKEEKVAADTKAEKTTDAKAKEKPAEEATAEAKPKKTKRSKKRTVLEGNVHVQASYNNTIITFTDTKGNVLAWSSAGASGFRGARKSTPYAAQVAAENATEKAKAYGFERAHVYVKGIGSGREQAVRALISAGVELLSITDATPLPHNGCRAKKRRRV